MTSETPSKQDSPIIIVGGGTWGCSTALHLARRGYKNVRVLDAYNIPSPISAGNDINKIVEHGSATTVLPSPTDSLSTILSRLASHGWIHDPIFNPYYHETGYVLAAHTAPGIKQVFENELSGTEYIPLTTPSSFRSTMPEGILTGDFPGWRGGHRKSGAGWVYARGALLSAYREASRLGVQFITGENGNVIKLLQSNDSNTITGVLTSNNTIHTAETVILSSGAQAPFLVNLQDQLRPTAWTLAHIKLTPTEQHLYTNLPVLFNIERGFFIEPSSSLGELKICDEHPGYCSFTRSPSGRITGSISFSKEQIPLESESRMRSFLADTMPHLTNRPLTFARLCWDADTTDRMPLIDFHPEVKGLVLAVGASGHGFMHIPSVGVLVVDLMEGKLDEKWREGMRWRPERAWGRDKNWTDVLDRMGAEGKVMDLKDVEWWTDVPERGVEEEARLVEILKDAKL